MFDDLTEGVRKEWECIHNRLAVIHQLPFEWDSSFKMSNRETHLQQKRENKNINQIEM